MARPTHALRGKEQIFSFSAKIRPTETVPSGARFFAAPKAAGRTITAGFAYLQRITRNGNIDVWFPEALRHSLNARLARGERLTPHDFPAAWAAVREFELLQEAGNVKIYDLDATYLSRTLVDLNKSMRAGGYRITVATIGSYTDDGGRDDLAILDERLQQRFSELARMMYMEEESRRRTDDNRDLLTKGVWSLPHIGVTLGARKLFRPAPKDGVMSAAEHRHALAELFFESVGKLPPQHIVHDTAVALQIPESTNEHEWIYCAMVEDTFYGLNSLLKDYFRPFDGLSLSRLRDFTGGHDEIKPTTQHMRGFGDRLHHQHDSFNRGLLQNLAYG